MNGPSSGGGRVRTASFFKMFFGGAGRREEGQLIEPILED